MPILRFWLISCTVLLLSWSQLKAQLFIEAFEPVHSQSLIEVFDTLAARYGLTFSYDADLLAGRRAPLVDISQKAVPEAVDLLLRRTCLKAEYRADRKHFTISYSPLKQARLQGFVFSGDYPDGLDGASVQLKGTPQRGDAVDFSGHFSFYCSCRDLDTLVIRRFDHKTLLIPLDPLERYFDSSVELEYNNPSLVPVLINDETPRTLSVHDQGVSTLTYRPQKVQNLGLGTPDVMRPLHLLPGIFSGDGTAGGLSIRGGGQSQNLMTFDGITLYQSDHFYGAFGVLNNRAVREVTLHRGGFDARWGGRASSVIEVLGSPYRADSLKAGVDLNLFTATAFVESPFFRKSDRNHAGFMLSTRLGSPTLFASPAGRNLFDQTFQSGAIAEDRTRTYAPDTDVALEPAFGFGDLTGRAVWQDSSRRFYLSTTGFASRNLMNYRHKVQTTQALEVTKDRLLQQQEGASLNWRQDWEGRRGTGNHRLGVAYSAFRTAYDYELTTGASEFDYEESLVQRYGVSDLSLRGDLAWREQRLRHQLEAGYFVGRLGTSAEEGRRFISQSPPDTLLLPLQDHTQSALLGGGYGQYSFRPDSNQYTLQAGLRYTYYGPTRQGYLAPRASLVVRPSQRLRLKLAAGRYYQFMQLEQATNGLQVGEDYWLLADGDSTDVLYADHVIAGMAFESGEHKEFLFELEAYHKRLHGLSTYTLLYNPFTTDRENERRLTGGQGWIWGVDLLMRRRFGDWYTTWVSYTALRAKQRYPGFMDGERFAANEDVRHFAKWVHVLSVGSQKQWDLSAAFSISSGLPYTQATGVELASGGIARDYPQVLFGTRNEGRLPARHQLDLALSYSLVLPDGRLPGSIGLSIYNVYNQRNISDRRFVGVLEDDPEAQPEVVITDRYLLGILPNVFASLHF
ncbi:MAG: hypothetical protein D6722_21525 [Bacteroidetes bacterium]|nr:MAG: hypothetical protein D6722_21525 [Bacteroidota bacterium]